VAYTTSSGSVDAAATDGAEAAAAAPNRYLKWFRRAMWAGIIQDWALGLPAIFAPEKTIRLARQRPTEDPTWTAFASLLVMLLSFSYIPGARDPFRYRTSAWLSVFARPPGVLFFLVLRRGYYPLFGIIDGVLSVIQIPLLALTFREEKKRGATMPKKAASGRRGEIEQEALFPYDGATFREVRDVAFDKPYAELPHHKGLGPGRFVRFFNDSTRNLIDRRDVLPHFDKLIHANGISYTGVWRIDVDSPYTGYFAKGSEGLAVARASVAGPRLEAGQRRAFGFGGKIFPTMDPDEKVMPGNFVTVSKLSGDKLQHIVDYAPTNKPSVGWDPGANLVNRVIFRLTDTRPGWRQLHPISTLGVPEDGYVRTPDLLKLEAADGTPRIDARDFRDELRLEHYPDNKLVYTINVKDFEDADWTRLGTIEFGDYAIAEGGDKRLHFWIPRDVPSKQ
jgi:hypothetical protein